MTQARFTLNPYTARVLDVVKGKFGLKNRNEALNKFIEEHGLEYADMKIDEQILAELDSQVEQHKKQFGTKAMTDKELDQLLGL